MDVKVKATKSNDGSIVWTIDGKHPKQSVIDVGKNKQNEKIDFDLDDQSRTGLRFNSDRPIDVAENTNGACPPAGIHTKEIEVLKCTSDKLKILDKNEKECTLHYQLNFVDDAGTSHPVDPEIRNGGGGGGGIVN